MSLPAKHRSSLSLESEMQSKEENGGLKAVSLSQFSASQRDTSTSFGDTF